MERSMRVIGKTTTNTEEEKNSVDFYFMLGIDNSWYEGDYIDGRKEGKGKYVWPDGSYYEGEWRENKINGHVIIYLKQRVSTIGLTVEVIRVSGGIITCMEREFTNGKMEESTKANTSMIRNKFDKFYIEGIWKIQLGRRSLL